MPCRSPNGAGWPRHSRGPEAALLAKDWVDIAATAEADTIDLERAAFRLRELLGDDARLGRLRALRR